MLPWRGRALSGNVVLNHRGPRVGFDKSKARESAPIASEGELIELGRPAAASQTVRRI